MGKKSKATISSFLWITSFTKTGFLPSKNNRFFYCWYSWNEISCSKVIQGKFYDLGAPEIVNLFFFFSFSEKVLALDFISFRKLGITYFWILFPRCKHFFAWTYPCKWSQKTIFWLYWNFCLAFFELILIVLLKILLLKDLECSYKQPNILLCILNIQYTI